MKLGRGIGANLNSTVALAVISHPDFVVVRSYN